jgi:hypothetical protein
LEAQPFTPQDRWIGSESASTLASEPATVIEDGELDIMT